MPRHWVSSLAVMLLAAAAAHAQERSRVPLPTDAEVARYGLVRRWYGVAPVDGVREQVQSVTAVGTQVHVQTDASRLHVMDGESGKLLWTAQLGRTTAGQFGSAINSKAVFVVNGTSLYRLDRETGSQIWSIRLPQVPSAAPAADEQRVLVSTVDGRIYVYDADTRQVVWYYQTDKRVSMPAVMFGERIACASEDRKLYLFQVSSRNPTFRYETEAPVSAPLAAWGWYVMVPSQDYNVYAVDVRNGATRWRYTSGAEIYRPIAVIENEIFVTPQREGLHALNAATERPDGERIWWYPRADEFMAASQKRVYAFDKMRQLVMLDRATGRLLGVWDTRDFDFRVRNESNDRLYVATRRGLVVCLHEKENQDPVMHQRVLPTIPGAKESGKAAGAGAKRPGGEAP